VVRQYLDLVTLLKQNSVAGSAAAAASPQPKRVSAEGGGGGARQEERATGAAAGSDGGGGAAAARSPRRSRAGGGNNQQLSVEELLEGMHQLEEVRLAVGLRWDRSSRIGQVRVRAAASVFAAHRDAQSVDLTIPHLPTPAQPSQHIKHTIGRQALSVRRALEIESVVLAESSTGSQQHQPLAGGGGKQPASAGSLPPV